MTDITRTLYDDIGFAIDSKYKILKVLGKGTYGVVCQATESSVPNGRKIAVKKVMKIFTNETLVKRAFRELRLMRHFRGHKNVGIFANMNIFLTLLDYQSLRSRHGLAGPI